MQYTEKFSDEISSHFMSTKRCQWLCQTNISAKRGEWDIEIAWWCRRGHVIT